MQPSGLDATRGQVPAHSSLTRPVQTCQLVRSTWIEFHNPVSLQGRPQGKDSAHWSYLLDTKGLLMYNGDGTFTATAAASGYSPLDLYLMGMLPKEQVPPMLLIDNPGIDQTQLPQLGATISGTAKTVTIADIIAAEEARVPDAVASQKKFNIDFVLLTRPGDSAASAAAAIENLRNAFAGRFAELTQSIGGLTGIAPSLNIVIDSPAEGATIIGPDVTVTGTVINSTGAETGVVVNDIPATVIGNHFVVDHAPLQEGSNTIAITATDTNGRTTATTKTVTAGPGHYIRLRPNIVSGTAPLEISFNQSGSFTPAAVQLGCTGPVTVAITPGTTAGDYTAKLTVEGSYTFTIAAQGPDNKTYRDAVTVVVTSRYLLANLLKAKWEGIKQKVAAMDIEGAVAYFPSSAQDYYRQVFTTLGARLYTFSEDLPPLDFVYATDNSAKGRLSRQETVLGQQKIVTYHVYFAQEDGIWKLLNF